MNLLVLIAYSVPLLWLLKRDTANRSGVSKAVWIPTLWVGILASRPVTSWLGVGGGDETLSGSPLDALFFFAMIFLSLITLSRRGLRWGELIRENWPIFLFYLFFLVSVLWANSPFSSLKRWTKEFGNIAVAMVILTEVNPLQALRAVFVRCALFLIPLSIIFIRYFPDMGRRYGRSGGLEITGVTTQKNSLGAMIMVCGLIFIWDWLERSRGDGKRDKMLQYFFPAVAAIGFYLLYISDSKTSILCLLVGSLIIVSVKFPLFRSRISALGLYSLVGAGIFFALDRLFGVSEALVSTMGRDMTFTGRTEVWKELFKLHIDPLIGTGFMSLWDDAYYRSRLPDWVAFSAHNGYLEIYFAGGLLGAIALGVMLSGVAARINRALVTDGNYGVVRFAVFVAMLIANFSESNYACMTPLGFLFLVTAIGHAPQSFREQEREWSTGASNWSQSAPRISVGRH